MTRDTVGKIASDLIVTQNNNTHSAHDQMLEQLSDYDRNLYELIERGKKEFSTDFYVIVLTKKERLMPNVLRNYFLIRFSCPTPEYDQTVYRYNFFDDCIDFLWTVPDKDTCIHMRQNALLLDKSEYDLLNFVFSFYDGSLLSLAKQLNNEFPNSPLLEK